MFYSLSFTLVFLYTVLIFLFLHVFFFPYVFVYRYTKITVIFLRKMVFALNISCVLIPGFHLASLLSVTFINQLMHSIITIVDVKNLYSTKV